MRLPESLAVVALSLLVFLPSFVLLYATHSTWQHRPPDDVASWRNWIFIAATRSAVLAVVLLIVSFAHNAPVLEGTARVLQTLLALTAVALWFLSVIGAWFGKGTARILLFCALAITVVAGYAMMMMTWG